MYKAQFTLDCIDETEGVITPFAGYTNGDHWNGWATPYFAKYEAYRIVRMLNKVYADTPLALSVTGPHQPYAWYEYENDCFVNLCENDIDEVEKWGGVEVEVDGQMLTLYAIGAYCWTWNTYEPE